MALFKNDILSHYNILRYDGDMLLLHCPKHEAVKAPFDGKLTKDGILSIGNIKLSFDMINLKDGVTGKVKAGTEIGMPIIKKDRGYIGLHIIGDDTIKYLNFKDDTVIDKPKSKKVTVEEE